MSESYDDYKDADGGTWKYCISCMEEFKGKTARLCPQCRKPHAIRDSEERLQEAYQRGVIPQLEDDPNEEDALDIEDDPRYSEEDIYDMFGLSEDDEDDEDWD